MPSSVREPIQVYLTRRERAALERLARRMGVSRSEVLRRGLAAIGHGNVDPGSDPMDGMVGAFDDAGPQDLAEGHDRYLLQALDAECPRPSS